MECSEGGDRGCLCGDESLLQPSHSLRQVGVCFVVVHALTC